ncbi:MAG: ABC transporter ATP-binding protein [Rhizobiaceae bacterium]|nr:ABC transporter ATP-binding protein [Rhizobiaceae bacterium]
MHLLERSNLVLRGGQYGGEFNSMVAIRLEGIRKAFGTVEVLNGIDLTVEDGEFVVFVGPSGCGKSTLLRIIAGLEEASAGELYFDTKPITNVAPAQRGVAMVFQSYALYPHMTVADNMTMSMRLSGIPKKQRRIRAEEVAEMLQLSPLLDRKPAQLSGGQRQRVAIGRAIVRNPDVFLFDEPLSNLDAALRIETRVGISQLHRTLGNTMVYVTHDQVEAMTMADRIVILDQGQIAQVGAPMDLYHHPANAFVAGFIGSPKMNFIPVTEVSRGNNSLRLASTTGEEFELGLHLTNDDQVALLGIRPENLKIDPDGQIAGTVTAVERLGSETLIYVAVGDATYVEKSTSDISPSIGGSVRLLIPDQPVHLFKANGQALAHETILPPR